MARLLLRILSSSVLLVSALFLRTSHPMREATGAGWDGQITCGVGPTNSAATNVGVSAPSSIRLGCGLRHVTRKDWQKGTKLNCAVAGLLLWAM